MDKKHVLIVSQDLERNEIYSWAISNNDFEFTVADNEERAIEISHTGTFDLAILDATDSSIDVKKLFAILPLLQQNIMMLCYEGESLEGLGEKVTGAFYQRKAERLSRLLVLDSSQSRIWNGLPSFSAN